MKIKNFLILFLLGLFLLFDLSGCADNSPNRDIFTPTSSPQPTLVVTKETAQAITPSLSSTTTQNPFRNEPQVLPHGITMKNPQGFPIELKSAMRDRDKVSATLCFILPSDEDWQFITRQSDVGLSVGENYYPVFDGFLVGDVIENKAGLTRCATLSFIVPPEQELSSFSIIVNQIATQMNETPDCVKAQEKLHQKNIGIVIQCNSVSNGYDITILQKPDGMSEDDAHLVVYQEGFTNTIHGPWVFNTGLFKTSTE